MVIQSATCDLANMLIRTKIEKIFFLLNIQIITAMNIFDQNIF